MVHGHRPSSPSRSPSAAAGTDAPVRSPAAAALLPSAADADASDTGTSGGDRSAAVERADAGAGPDRGGRGGPGAASGRGALPVRGPFIRDVLNGTGLSFSPTKHPLLSVLIF